MAMKGMMMINVDDQHQYHPPNFPFRFGNKTITEVKVRAYLIFVIFSTQPQFEAWKFYT